MARVGFSERDSPQIGVGSEQEEGIFLSSCPFRHLLSQLSRFRERGTALGD